MDMKCSETEGWLQRKEFVVLCVVDVIGKKPGVC